MRLITLAVALCATMFSVQLHGQPSVLDQRVGSATATCSKDPFTGSLVCVVLSGTRPSFGYQFGSARDPKSVALEIGYMAAIGTGADVRVDSFPAHSIVDGQAFDGGTAATILREIQNGSKIRVRFTPLRVEEPAYGEFDLSDFKGALRLATMLLVPEAQRTGRGFGGGAAPVDSSGLPSTVPLDGWRVSLKDCISSSSSMRCTVLVANTTKEKQGFRLEDVRAVSGNTVGEKARDFNYYPRASPGMESSQGNCDPSSVCTVQLTVPANTDEISFSLSLWTASFGGRKVIDSQRTTLALHAPRP
jgi:hypothetical protein